MLIIYIYFNQCFTIIMASPKSQTTIQPTWDTEPIVLKDFLMVKDVPHIARVVKGQFMNIGTSKFNPLKKLHQDILVHSIKTGLKVLGHSVMRVDSRDGRTHRLVSLEQRLSIPVTYKGWFELLSEDGRSIRPIETVLQLAKLFPKVNSVLVRQNVKACLLNESDAVCDKSRVVTAGEQLTLTGDVSRQLPTESGPNVRLLKCVDSNGETLYLRLDQKGSFMPIASPTDIMGVFRIKDVIERFRLPLTLKLVQGVWPKVDSSRFTGIIRLDWAYTDETAFVCPLDNKGTPRIYPVPTEVNLRLTSATNSKEVLESGVLTAVMAKCNRLVANYHNTIHLIISVPEGAVKAKSHTMANLYSQTNPKAETPAKSQMKRSKSREDILLDQVDDLYGYLQMGKQPPASKYARDSDEETYYEEPEFEPMTKFKDRLALLDRGDIAGSQKNATYNFINPRTKMDANHNILAKTRTNGHQQQSSRPVSAVASPPELPPRQYKDKPSDSAPFVTYINSVTGSRGSDGSGKIVTNSWTLQRSTSKDNTSQSTKSKTSIGSSGNSVEHRLSSTGSKENRSSQNGSMKHLKSRRSMPLLYL